MSFGDELNRQLKDYKSHVNQQRKDSEERLNAEQHQRQLDEQSQARTAVQQKAEADQFFRQLDAKIKFEQVKNRVWGMGDVLQEIAKITLHTSYEDTTSDVISDDGGYSNGPSYVTTINISLSLECKSLGEGSFELILAGELPQPNRLVTRSVQEAIAWLDQALIADSLERAKDTNGELPVYPQIARSNAEWIRKNFPNHRPTKKKGFWESLFG